MQLTMYKKTNDNGPKTNHKCRMTSKWRKRTLSEWADVEDLETGGDNGESKEDEPEVMMGTNFGPG